MFIVMVAPECAPVAQAGGLGEVINGLSRELELRGHAVEIILPKYDCMEYRHIYDLQVSYQDLWVPWFDGAVHCSVWFGHVHGRKCFFIEPHSVDRFFERGHFYGSPDDVMRFAFFSKAALEFLVQSGKRPEIIHVHDWQTALVPVLLYEQYEPALPGQRVCFTIHNFGHQGLTGGHVLRATGLDRPEHFFHIDRLRDNLNPFALNLVKGGIVYSNFVNTVSPRYAWEVMHTDQGMGLGHTLHVHHRKFGGVLNGLDYDVWNPEIDPFLVTRYTADTIERKDDNTAALRERLGLQPSKGPIVCYIGRLDRQKGVHLIQYALWYSLSRSAQFVAMGKAPDPAVNHELWALKNHLEGTGNPDSMFWIGWDESLSHQLLAGAHLFVMPSMFEPCGLSQMQAMKYGTVPVVRAVGGLVDTVFDRDWSDRPVDERNGYLFEHTDPLALETALGRAIDLFYTDREAFRDLQVNGMRADYSWAKPGQHYLDIYEFIRAK